MSFRFSLPRVWCLYAFCIPLVAGAGAASEEAFLRAVRADLQVAAAHLLEEGANVEATDADGTTVLMWAARHGNRAMVEALLAARAEPRRARSDGYTLLMAAAESGDVQLFDVVVRRIGIGGLVTSSNYSLLMAAAQGGDSGLFNRVRQRDADLDRVTDLGYTLLMAAAEGGNPAIFETVRKRLNTPDDLRARPATGETLLHYAARGGSPVILRQLLAEGLTAVIDARDLAGDTPLLVAASGGQSAIMRLLLENGADPLIADLRGRTPLHHVATRGNRAGTAILLGAGVEPNVSDDRGRTPLHDVLRYFGDCGFVQPYSRAEERSLSEAEEALRLLLVRGADTNAADAAGETAVHFLARTRFPGLVPTLRAAGADFSILNHARQTPPTIAEANGYQPMIEVLRRLSSAD